MRDAVGATSEFLGSAVRDVPVEDPRPEQAGRFPDREHGTQAIFLPFLPHDHDDHRRVNQLLLAISKELPADSIEVWAYHVYSTVIPNVVVDITDCRVR